MKRPALLTAALLLASAARADVRIAVDRFVADGPFARVLFTVSNTGPGPVELEVSCVAFDGRARVAVGTAFVDLLARDTRTEDMLIHLNGAGFTNAQCSARTR